MDGAQVAIFRDIACKPFNDPYNTAIRGGPDFPSTAPDFVFNRRGRDLYKPKESNRNDLALASASIAVKKAIYGGPLNHHFGHFMAESTHRLWYAISEDLESPVLFFAIRNHIRDLQIWASEFFQLWGLRNRIRIVTSPTLVNELIVPEPGKILGEPNKPWYLSWLNEKCPVKISDRADLPSHLAVTRGHMKTGRFIGEQQVEGILSKNGYFIFRPEKHSIEDQIRHYTSAERIIFTEGSAFHALETIPRVKADICIISRRYFGHRLASHSLQEKCNSLTIFQDIVSLPPVGRDGKFLAAAWIDPNSVVSFLKEYGFLSKECCFQNYITNDYNLDDIIMKDFLDFVQERLRTQHIDFSIDIPLRLLAEGISVHENKFSNHSASLQSARRALGRITAQKNENADMPDRVT
ncbi:glycosyltransferase family 61 protein [Roseomonas eburnea]|uniref:Glycosyltransferase family 61 protein n=1 Tax=Neoroseomonas eburnea TaxID=1346889 RepID=A0A9X9XA14_9PROT|nr:glycosyltransferase family 61 protein [Neoroseomonas eburnea]